MAGSGLPAAVIMGQYFEPGALATVICAVFEPALDQAHICLAGHFAPVIALPGQPTEQAPIAQGPMIGISPAAPRPVTTIPIPPEALLCFYSDGLVERPGEFIDDGLERLRLAVVDNALPAGPGGHHSRPGSLRE